MIKTRSTYNITYNLDFSFDTIIDVYIWQGDNASVPASPTYTVTDTNPESKATATINIANWINDFIEFETFSRSGTGLVNNPNTLNVRIDRTVDGVTTNLLQDFGVKGYYSAIEGSNVGLPSNKILMQGDYMRANKTSKVLIPLVPDGTNVQIVSSPNSEINLDLTVATSTDTADYFKSLWIDCSELDQDNEIEITYNSETYLIEVVEECKYDPIDIFFINKEGQMQSFTFFKERKESMKTTKDTFQRSGVSVFNGNHQYVDYNLNARTSFKMNSGFVEESQNETFRQMLNSERVWQYDGSKFIPLNLETSSIEYQNRVNDRLIKYTIDFKYSFDEISTI